MNMSRWSALLERRRGNWWRHQKLPCSPSPASAQSVFAKLRRSGARRTIVQIDKKKDEDEDEVLLSTAALGWASLGALLGLFFGAATVGFPICISSTVIGGIFGGVLGRYLR